MAHRSRPPPPRRWPWAIAAALTIAASATAMHHGDALPELHQPADYFPVGGLTQQEPR
jgi:hypothetical protein